MFDNVEVPHFNYVGDSVLGYKAHFGAGAVTSNVKSDKTLVMIKNEFKIEKLPDNFSNFTLAPNKFLSIKIYIYEEVFLQFDDHGSIGHDIYINGILCNRGGQWL